MIRGANIDIYDELPPRVRQAIAYALGWVDPANIAVWLRMFGEEETLKRIAEWQRNDHRGAARHGVVAPEQKTFTLKARDGRRKRRI